MMDEAFVYLGRFHGMSSGAENLAGNSWLGTADWHLGRSRRGGEHIRAQGTFVGSRLGGVKGVADVSGKDEGLGGVVV
jgi:hypothetical protein